MTRKPDSGWRDEALNQWHVNKGFPCPAAGMSLPMIEYDRGLAVGLVNYVRRGDTLPTGPDVASAYRAFGRVYGTQPLKPLLPFLTATYDSRNWALRLFPHNKAAEALVRRVADDTGADGWAMVTEAQFAELLYAMRGRPVPDLFGYDVEWSQHQWFLLDPLGDRTPLPFPCSDMSDRRRQYEPDRAAPMRVKLPCLDVDLALVDHESQLVILVDYKRMSAVCDPAGTNATAMASLWGRRGMNVPAFMTRYFGAGEGAYRFETLPLNATAQTHLCYVLGAVDAPAPILAQAVAGGWVRLTERHWLEVLKVARDL